MSGRRKDGEEGTWAFGRCRCAQAGWTGGGGSVCVGHEIEIILDRVQDRVVLAHTQLRWHRRFITNRVEMGKICGRRINVWLVGSIYVGVMVRHGK
jgi:hypothetical protein